MIKYTKIIIFGFIYYFLKGNQKLSVNLIYICGEINKQHNYIHYY